MNTQPDSLRMADTLERMSISTKWDKEAAAELRRLHEVNQELVEALKYAFAVIQGQLSTKTKQEYSLDKINTALLKAAGEKHD